MSETSISETQNNPSFAFYSDALLIAEVTLLGYLSAFLYSFGYYGTFGVPVFLMDLSIGGVLAASCAGILFVGLFVIIGETLFSLKRVNRTVGTRWFSFLGFVLFILYLPLVIFAYGPYNAWPAIIVGVVGLSLIVSTLYSFYRLVQKRPITDKRGTSSYGLFFMIKDYGVMPFLIFFCVEYLVASQLCGGFVARNQADFLVLSSTPPMVIIGSTGDSLIGLFFDGSEHNVTHSTLVTKDFISTHGMMMTVTKVGPLKLAP